jgi:hypothetical protein
MKVDQAREMADARFRALAGVGDGEPVRVVADASTFRPLFVGLPLDATEALFYAHQCAQQVCWFIAQGLGPGEQVVGGAILRAFLVGALVGANADG